MLATAARAACGFTDPVDSRFVVVPQAPYVRVVVELWVGGSAPGWGAAMLDALDARHVPGMVVVPIVPPDDEMAALLARARAEGHGIAVVVDPALLPRDKDSLRALKQAMEPITGAAGRVKTAVAPIGNRTIEAMLGRAGFRSLVDTRGTATAEPRMAGLFDNQPRTRVVLPVGPYVDPCGADPHVAPFTPAAGDRAARAIVRAARVKQTPIVRVALDGADGAPTDAEVLGRWLDEVVIPSGASVVTAEKARLAALRGFRYPNSLPELPPDPGGRMIAVADVERAAQGLAGVTLLPRTLPGDLDPTEAFYAFAELVAGRLEGDAVRLGALSGPANQASSSLDGPTTVSAAAVRTVATQLAAQMPAEIPAALSVDGRLLTAGELLVALAGVVRGEDPVPVGPIDDPDPNARGLGWGESKVP
jgi:hypothetical protein